MLQRKLTLAFALMAILFEPKNHIFVGAEDMCLARTCIVADDANEWWDQTSIP